MWAACGDVHVRCVVVAIRVDGSAVQRILDATGAFEEDPATARIRLPETWG